MIRLLGLALCFSGAMSGQEAELAAEEPSARVVGKIADGSPSPAPPKPDLPDFRVLDTQIRIDKGRIVSVHQVEPPELSEPDPTPAPLSIEELEALRRSAEESPIKKNEFCMVSATVYDHQRTLIQWWPEGSKTSWEAWSNVDFNLLGGFHAFEGRGRRYLMILGLGNLTTVQFELDQERRREAEVPELRVPKLPSLEDAGPVYMVTRGDTEDEQAMAIMDTLHDLYEAQERSLRGAYVLREKHRLEREAELKENPPKKKDLEIYFWRNGGK